MTTGLYSYGQSSKSTPAKVKTESEKVDSTTKDKTPAPFPSEYIDTVSIFTDSTYPNFTYTDSTGIVVTIQNSGPRGEPYAHPSGKTFGKAIFWTRVINETDTPLELIINFPADSFAIPPLPDSYLKLYVLPDTMTYEKLTFYNHGVSTTDLKSFLDTGLNKPTMLQRTINPKEECFFHIVALSFQSGGMVRAGLVLKEQDLFYRISIIPHFDSALFPCGQIVFKKL